MEETWTVGSVPDDVEDVAERVTSMARLKRRHTQAIETERRLAQKTEALQSTLGLYRLCVAPFEARHRGDALGDVLDVVGDGSDGPGLLHNCGSSLVRSRSPTRVG